MVTYFNGISKRRLLKCPNMYLSIFAIQRTALVRPPGVSILYCAEVEHYQICQNVPILKACPYEGDLSSSVEIDIDKFRLFARIHSAPELETFDEDGYFRKRQSKHL